MRKYIHPLAKIIRPSVSAGQKGLFLHQLIKLGLPVPETHYCDWKAYKRFHAGDFSILESIGKELENLIDPNKTYAVRSSGNLEDNTEYSFAGQFDTVLNVQGVPAIISAIKKVWCSVNSQTVQAYLNQHNLKDSIILMAVLIQEMISPIYSGVALSKNPVTCSDEIIVEAVQGEGTRLVQNGYTPERWINKWGLWIEKNKQSKIPLSIIEDIVNQTKDIAEAVNFPVDLEWVFDGKNLFWVQLREIGITHHHNIYANHMSREMFPGLIKPLPFSIGAGIMGKAVKRWMEEILGYLPIDVENLVKPFYYHAYFNMGEIGKILERFGFPAESMEILLGVLPRGAGKKKMKPSLKTFSLLPNALVFFIKKTYFHRMHSKLDIFEEKIKESINQNLETLDPGQILERIEHHYDLVLEIAYCTSLSLFFLSMFNRALKRQLSRRGIEFNNFEITKDMSELDEFYPTNQLQLLNEIYQKFSSEERKLIESLAFTNHPNLSLFSEHFNTFMEHFGHLGDCGNDFSVPPWRETPKVVIKMIIDYKPPAPKQTPKTCLDDLNKWDRINPIFMQCYKRTREFQYLRERSSKLYTQGKLMFRNYYLALADHFVKFGMFDRKEDIFYLTPKQINQLVVNELPDIQNKITSHKKEMESLNEIQLPPVIYGETPPPLCKSNSKTLLGVATSIGIYTGRVCVVRNEMEFAKLKTGEVLVIPYSDVSWTHLFARAGALISESGGVLSHGSIIAREYNLPAIVSVNHATSLNDGDLVTVDAQQGIIQVLEEINTQ